MVWILSAITLLLASVVSADSSSISIPAKSSPPASASTVLARNFLSFSVEFAFWADFAGNKSHPNEFSNNLFANLRAESGGEPIIRIGGNTQDHVTYVADQEQGIINIFNYAYNLDQPQNSSIGPKFWESFNTLDGLQYIFGLNFYKNDSTYAENLRNEVSQSIKQIPADKLHLFEIGNENDYGALSGFRPPDWTQYDYVSEWHNRSRLLEMVNEKRLRFFAPSFCCFNISTNYSFFSPRTVWNSSFGYDRDRWINEVSQHGYISSTSLPNTLQGTLMNHTGVEVGIANFISLNDFHRANGRTFTIGETNSISGQGAFNVSDVFGAALWEIDYSLLIAANNISRIHLHQGTSYRYGSWQPIEVNGTGPLTKPAYYGNVFVARFLGNSGDTQIANFPLEGEHNVAYAAYDGGKLARLAFLNMLEYNGTSQGTRPTTCFSFEAPKGCGSAKLTRLTAPMATSNDTITFGGYAYDYKYAKGKPVKLFEANERISPQKGAFNVEVGASEAVIISLD
ncbi:family 79 glycoside hydrolase [Rhizodiscina lignyota]|uniref:Family 79 glycoside hydrolase n=1 Tax=Rhizodiscina lignyota TaxID=1504668 RepID=A0A9P4IQ52_9PEZI|nr:family 79 glycoside hydrolase [Rhizodiscina lignyota]